MSPEEFDNRLRSSFQEEYLPPKENLWVNISGKLDQKAKMPVWQWLLPVIIVATVAILWIGNGISDLIRKDEAKSGQSQQNNIAITEKTDEPGNAPESIALDRNIADRNHAPSGITEPEKVIKSESPASTYRRNQSEMPQKNALDDYLRNFHRRATFSGNHNSTPNSNSVANPDFTEDLNSTFKISGYPNFENKILFDDLFLVALEKSKTPEKPKDNSENSLMPDLNSRHWFSFGLGPQLALNSLNISDDSQAYIHKHMWENKKLITNNGTGFNCYVDYAYKFGKNNRFSFETGLNYSLRTEDIKFNESTYDIAARDNNNKISNYFLLKVWIAIPKVPGPGYDTTYYNAIQNFSMAVNNKYHVLTVPFRFNSEHKISESSYFSVGIGAGMSMISARQSKYYDLVHEKERSSSKQRFFTGSLNSRLSLYTNFNDIGQIGFYTGFQTYLKPWTVSNKQYSISMSDVQLGIMFRRPL